MWLDILERVVVHMRICACVGMRPLLVKKRSGYDTNDCHM